MVNTDFAKLIAALKKAGVNQSAIADKLGVTRANISKLSMGCTDPLFSTGAGIIQLHEYHCGEKK